MIEILKNLFISDKCISTSPWMTAPAFPDINEPYGGFNENAFDNERLQNWIKCRKQRSSEILPLALLIACIILLMVPKTYHKYVDYVGYLIAIIGIVGYLTAEHRAKYEYKTYLHERKMTGFSHKEFINWKKRNFGPFWHEII